GNAGSQPSGLVELGGKLLFAAGDGVHGPGLWRSDGTPGGTTLVKAIHSVYGEGPSSLTVVGDRLFFVVGADACPCALWTSDGTADGTTRIRRFDVGGI